MSIFDGLTELVLGADPGSGVNPPVGYIYTWIEFDSPNYNYKYKTSAGVVGNIGTSGTVSGNISVDNITANGNITLTGSNQYLSQSLGWKDNVANFTSAKIGGGGSQPTWTNVFDGLYAYGFDPSTLQELWISFHINHDYEVGTNIFPHIHWMPSSTDTGTVRWGYEYSIAKGHSQSVFPASSTIYVEQAASGTTFQHQIAEHATGISSTELETDTVVLMRVFRDAAHANDTFTGVAYGVAGDLHYQSRKEMTLNKAPNFNV